MASTEHGQFSWWILEEWIGDQFTQRLNKLSFVKVYAKWTIFLVGISGIYLKIPKKIIIAIRRLIHADILRDIDSSNSN